MWDQSKIDYQRDYLAKQRRNPTGNFSEYVVRVYYYILRKCSEYPGDCCPARNIDYREMAQIAYAGIYDEPDHDYKNVMDSCKRHLKEMGYIHLENRSHEWWIRVLKPLDFLAPGEHEKYIDIFCSNINAKTNTRKSQETTYTNGVHLKDGAVLCDRCGEKMKLRSGRYGIFFGCSRFPSCKGTKDLAIVTHSILQENGVTIYEVKRPCWKCGQEISVYSYFPKFDLCDSVPALDSIEELYIIRLSVLQTLDQWLMKTYNTVQIVHSQKAMFSYPANICPHCRSLQGSNLTLNPVYDFLEAQWRQGRLQDFVSARVPISEQTLPFEEWRETLSEIQDIS